MHSHHTAPRSEPRAGPGQHWSVLAKWLHWVVALLIAVQLVVGWMAATWRLSPTKLELFVWHKSTGLLVLLLVVVRLAWRLTHTAPALPADMPRWERRAAAASHFLLYAAMLALPLSGWVVNSASGVPFSIYWLVPLPAIAPVDRHVTDVASAVHLVLGILLIALVAIHVVAALRHHFIKRDDVLVRMLPRKRSSAT
ncbi:MAG: cytochrome b, partial [Proteobacteria bacterium]|nr:cytochrome b [Pseudomonadota bacterium]